MIESGQGKRPFLNFQTGRLKQVREWFEARRAQRGRGRGEGPQETPKERPKDVVDIPNLPQTPEVEIPEADPNKVSDDVLALIAKAEETRMELVDAVAKARTAKPPSAQKAEEVERKPYEEINAVVSFLRSEADAGFLSKILETSSTETYTSLLNDQWD